MAVKTEAISVRDEKTTTRLARLLAMEMFVLVVDTSMMNVSISAVGKITVCTCFGSRLMV